MSVPVSDRWLLASDAGGARPISKVTATAPGQSPVTLDVDGCVVTKSLDKGPRFEANVSVQRVVGQRSLELVQTPGALFVVTVGWDYGAGQTESIPMGVYEVARQPKASRTGTIPLTLMDQWKRLEECRFTSKVTGAIGAGRAALVASQVTGAIPGIEVRTSTGGGTIGTATDWEESRTQLINDLSRDGSFGAGFAADGAFVIEPLPTLGNPVVTYTDGANAKIIDLSTEQTMARLYNAVTVKPTDDQGWAAVTVAINDTDHPRHPDKIGLRPYFMTAPTAANQNAAKGVAQHRRLSADRDSHLGRGAPRTRRHDRDRPVGDVVRRC